MNYNLALTEDEAAVLDLDELARQDPEKAAILIDKALKRQLSDARENWIIQARMLHHLKTTELWRHHPENFNTFFEYCSQPDIDIAPSIVSDMLAICKFAPALEDAGIDIWSTLRTAGSSKVRQIIPQIRDAYRSNVLQEQIAPLVSSIENMRFREILELTATSGIRSQYELEAVYDEDAYGNITVSFKNLDIDALEQIAKKNNIKRWYDKKGLRIEPPMNET